jgi:hypothetical protein
MNGCVGEHEGDFPPKVQTPNPLGLCTECYVHRMKMPPPFLEAWMSPGVVPVEEENSDKKVSSVADHKSSHGKNNSELIVPSSGLSSITVKEDVKVDDLESDEEVILCNWRPSAEESLGPMRGYVCCNPVFRNPNTKAQLKTCAMHVRYCIMTHTVGSGQVEIPNVHGLCNSHHVGLCGRIPLTIPFPYPGMRRKLREKGWLIKPGHWAAPTWPPMKAIISNKVRIIREIPEGYLDRMRETARVIAYLK